MRKKREREEGKRKRGKGKAEGKSFITTKKNVGKRRWGIKIMIKIKIKNFLPPHNIKTANCTAKHNAVQNISDRGTLYGTSALMFILIIVLIKWNNCQRKGAPRKLSIYYPVKCTLCYQNPLKEKAAEKMNLQAHIRQMTMRNQTITQGKPLKRRLFLVQKLQNKPHFLHQVIKEHKTGKENFHDA